MPARSAAHTWISLGWSGIGLGLDRQHTSTALYLLPGAIWYGAFRAYKFMTLQVASQPHRAGSVGRAPIFMVHLPFICSSSAWVKTWLSHHVTRLSREPGASPISSIKYGRGSGLVAARTSSSEIPADKVCHYT